MRSAPRGSRGRCCGWVACPRRSGRSGPTVELVQPLHSDVVVALHEPARDVVVERVGQDGVAGAGSGRGGARGRPTTAWCRACRPQLAPGSQAGGGERLGGTWVSTLPNCSSPRALASRRAGSTVRRAPCRPGEPRHGHASAAAMVVLPTPPEPQVIRDLLGREQLLDGRPRAPGAPSCGRSHQGELGARGTRRSAGSPADAVAPLRTAPGRTAAAGGAARLRSAPRCSARVRRSVTARRPLEQRRDARRRLRREHLGPDHRAFEHLLLAPAEQLGQHPVDDDRGEIDRRSPSRGGRTARWSR